MHRETFIAKLTQIQQNVGQLLARLQASEHDKFAAHLYRLAGNTGQPVITPESPASQSSAA
jgi:hypothetical protein